MNNWQCLVHTISVCLSVPAQSRFASVGCLDSFRFRMQVGDHRGPAMRKLAGAIFRAHPAALTTEYHRSPCALIGVDTDIENCDTK